MLNPFRTNEYYKIFDIYLQIDYKYIVCSTNEIHNFKIVLKPKFKKKELTFMVETKNTDTYIYLGH